MHLSTAAYVPGLLEAGLITLCLRPPQALTHSRLHRNPQQGVVACPGRQLLGSQSSQGGLKLPLIGSVSVVLDNMCFAPHPPQTLDWTMNLWDLKRFRLNDPALAHVYKRQGTLAKPVSKTGWEIHREMGAQRGRGRRVVGEEGSWGGGKDLEQSCRCSQQNLGSELIRQ